MNSGVLIMNFKPLAFLNKGEKLVLDFVKDFTQRNGMPPNQVEIFNKTDYTSVTTISNILKRLVQRGYLAQSAGLSRGTRPSYLVSIPIYKESVGKVNEMRVDSRMFDAPPHLLVELVADSLVGKIGDLIAIHKPSRIEREVFGSFTMVGFCEKTKKVVFGGAYRTDVAKRKTLKESDGILVGAIRRF